VGTGGAATGGVAAGGVAGTGGATGGSATGGLAGDDPTCAIGVDDGSTPQLCCRGADSTYTIRVGRSTAIEGPFVDKNGTELLSSGGTLLVSDGSAWVGPGGESVLIDGTDAYLVYHAYDANASGNSIRMHISELFWDDTGWPVTAPTPP
jgi:hypothetical protein